METPIDLPAAGRLAVIAGAIGALALAAVAVLASEDGVDAGTGVRATLVLT